MAASKIAITIDNKEELSLIVEGVNEIIGD